MKTIYYAVILLFLNTARLGAQSGMLDTTFGSGGITVTNISSTGNSQDSPNVAALQPDGKILVAGSTASGNTGHVALLRYLPNGALDDSFGGDGIVTADFSGSGNTAYGMAVQPDGKILLAGIAAVGNNYDFGLARFLPDGSPDSTFGTAGKVHTDLGTTFEYANAIALQADGKIVVAGKVASGFDADIAVVRYNASGSVDSTFGSAGIVVTTIGDEDEARSVAIQPDGKIIVAGFAAISAVGDFAMVRYLPDGTLDSDFGNGGIVTTDPAGIGNSDLATSMMLLPDGKILLAGYANYVNIFFSADLGLVQYNPDGSLDENFGTGGISIINPLSSFLAWNIARQPDGKLLIAGQAVSVNFDQQWALLRTRPTGSLDPDFGNNGVVTADMEGSNEYAAAVLIQPDSKLVVAGRVGVNTNYNFALARYIADFYLSASLVQGISCYGSADAVVSVEASGGIPPYEYSINGVDFQTSSTFSGLAAGTYTITILDSNGDGVTGSISGIVVPEHPAPPAVHVDVVNNTITVQVAGPGSFQYSNGLVFQPGNVFSNLANGTYPIVVLDENGCTIFADSVLIDFTGLNEAPPPADFKISPNPGSGYFTLDLAAFPATGSPQLTVTDLLGRSVYAAALPDNRPANYRLNLSFLPTGDYQLRIRDGKSQAMKKLVILR